MRWVVSKQTETYFTCFALNMSICHLSPEGNSTLKALMWKENRIITAIWIVSATTGMLLQYCAKCLQALLTYVGFISSAFVRQLKRPKNGFSKNWNVTGKCFFISLHDRNSAHWSTETWQQKSQGLAKKTRLKDKVYKRAIASSPTCLNSENIFSPLINLQKDKRGQAPIFVFHSQCLTSRPILKLYYSDIIFTSQTFVTFAWDFCTVLS